MTPQPATVVYGFSDDLIEIEGQLEDELELPSTDELTLKFSDGTVVKARYDGEWYFDVLVKGTLVTEVWPIGHEQADNDYTQTVCFGAGLTGVETV